MKTLQQFYKGKKVLITGHTGFKGSWLSIWLQHLGATVYGYALEEESGSLFELASLGGTMNHRIGDVRDFSSLKEYINQIAPDLIFHLAAQPLVRNSYEAPRLTYEVNVNGTLNLLEICRQANRSVSLICITTDKSYDNKEWLWGYRENDAMGGFDPYSSSKGCCELLIDSYNKSFFLEERSPVRLASVRAGNVIGGGDRALDRIVPDSIRALEQQVTIEVRNPYATRPWQHVLEPLGGYLWLGKLMTEHEGKALCTAFNFGPQLTSNRSVGELVSALIAEWGVGNWESQWQGEAPHEAGMLNLATDKAFHLLGWFPVWDFEETIKQTVHWYQNQNNSDPYMLCKEQILDYQYKFFQSLKNRLPKNATPINTTD
ncbi:CDP-glucose 4,6-dehydratase [Persicobacter diffluens]|uniref:CDP-glucose 4,6-dehydratase n=1 Tax=Persicobacter diffluens TaxID=981 RepID=A0AAN4W2Y2_9BACT|nr:CDP-glucose 4,6-dehydratase [Persicobacter diffluens]